MKKGQIEMIGLVIVVIILVIGGILYLRFGVLGKKEVKNDVTVETSYIVNTLNALLNVKVCSNSISMEETMMQCLNRGENICDKEPCQYLEEQTKLIVGSIGITNKYKYSISIEKNGATNEIVRQCETGSLADVKVSDASGEAFTVKMRLC